MAGSITIRPGGSPAVVPACSALRIGAIGIGRVARAPIWASDFLGFLGPAVVQRRVRRCARPSIPRSVSHVRASRAKAIVMLISSKFFDLMGALARRPVVSGGRLECFGVAPYVSVGSAGHSVTCVTSRDLIATRSQYESKSTHWVRALWERIRDSRGSRVRGLACCGGCAGRDFVRSSWRRCDSPVSSRHPHVAGSPRRPESGGRSLPVRGVCGSS